LSLFSLGSDDLRRSKSAGFNELRRVVRLGRGDQRLLHGSDDLIDRLGCRRSSNNHISFSLLRASLPSASNRLGGLGESSILLFIIHVGGGGLDFLEVCELSEVTAEAFESAKVTSHHGSKHKVVHEVAQAHNETSSFVVAAEAFTPFAVTLAEAFSPSAVTLSMVSSPSTSGSHPAVSSMVTVFTVKGPTMSMVMLSTELILLCEFKFFLKDFFVSFLSFRLNFSDFIKVRFGELRNLSGDLSLTHRLAHLRI